MVPKMGKFSCFFFWVDMQFSAAKMEVFGMEFKSMVTALFVVLFCFSGTKICFYFLCLSTKPAYANICTACEDDVEPQCMMPVMGSESVLSGRVKISYRLDMKFNMSLNIQCTLLPNRPLRNMISSCETSVIEEVSHSTAPIFHHREANLQNISTHQNSEV